jgi:hypothetical protein
VRSARQAVAALEVVLKLDLLLLLFLKLDLLRDVTKILGLVLLFWCGGRHPKETHQVHSKCLIQRQANP